MPRGGKKNANQHNNRHENGVVAPGKRIVRQKSNGHINASPEGRALAHSTSAAPNGTSGAHGKQERQRSVAAARDDSDSGLAPPERSADSLLRPDGPSRSHVSHDGLVPLALTVLTNCPLRDTLAILIFLLSLPPAIITITNALFAFLTFVPPSGSFTAMPTLSDFTSSFSPGTPSVIVTLLIDFLAGSLHGFLPKELQGLTFELAQAMVATTLGGGYNHKTGGKDNTILCAIIVAASHFSRYLIFLLQPLHRTYLAVWIPALDGFNPEYIDRRYPLGQNRTWWDTVKSWIALHIFCQGVTRMIRRLLYSSRTGPSRPPPRSEDGAMSTGADLTDSQPMPHSPMELRPRSSMPNLRESRERVSSGKRRRKQANYVRAQQPLWAAFAGTKATVLREYELSRASAEASSAHAGQHDFGNAPFEKSENRIWISTITETSIFFEMSALSRTRPDEDTGKPVYVQCNQTNWSSLKLEAIPGSEDEWRRPRWAGEVYGLSAGKTYLVSFFRSDDNTLVYSQTIATVVSPVAPATPSHQLRPPSPVSPSATLKSSTDALEKQRDDLLAQQRRIKRENKSSATALRREVDVLQEKLSRNSNTDKTLQSRQQQQSQHMKQAVEAINSLTKELDSFCIPESESTNWNQRKKLLDGAKKEQTSAHEDLLRSREEKHRLITTRESEGFSAKHKRQRLESRLERVTKQHERLISVSEEPEKTKPAEQSRLMPSRAHIEDDFEQQIHAISRSIQELTTRYASIQGQLFALEKAAEQQQQQQQAQQQHLSQQQQRLSSLAADYDSPDLGSVGLAPASSATPSSSAAAFARHSFPGPAHDLYANPSLTSSGAFAPAHPVLTPHQLQQQQQQQLPLQQQQRGRSGSVMSADAVAPPPLHEEEDEDDNGLIPSKVKRRSARGGSGGGGGGAGGLWREGSEGSGGSANSPSPRMH